MNDKEKAIKFFEDHIQCLHTINPDYKAEAKAHLDALRDKPKEKMYFKGQYGRFYDHCFDNEITGYLDSLVGGEYKRMDGGTWDGFEPLPGHPWWPKWIPHTGDECPVDDNKEVNLMFSDGQEVSKTKAGEWEWGQTQTNRITHYAYWHEIEWL